MKRKHALRAELLFLLTPFFIASCVATEIEGRTRHFEGFGTVRVADALFIGIFENGISEDVLANMRLEHEEKGCHTEAFGEKIGTKTGFPRFYEIRCEMGK